MHSHYAVLTASCYWPQNHIGLPLVRPANEVMVQISKLDKELNLLHLHSLSDALQRDPDLAHRQYRPCSLPHNLHLRRIHVTCIRYREDQLLQGVHGACQIHLERPPWVIRSHIYYHDEFGLAINFDVLRDKKGSSVIIVHLLSGVHL